MGFGSLCWLLLIPGALAFQQNQYKLIYERLELAGFNPIHVDFAKTHNFKYNRTNAVTNFTIALKTALENETKLEVQAYRLASNEYREFPLRFMFDYCEYSARKEFGLNELYACGNSSGCPFKKAGIYRSCTWAPNGNRFPPYIPKGSYMLDLKFYYRSVEFLFLQLYATIKYPECKGCNF